LIILLLKHFKKNHKAKGVILKKPILSLIIVLLAFNTYTFSSIPSLHINQQNTQTNKLYEGSIGTSVDASIDHRFFSEEGRKDIKEDIKTTSNFISLLVSTALKRQILPFKYTIKTFPFFSN
jgi:hypothetical protein